VANLLDPDALRYFFGPQFNVDVAMAIMPIYKDVKSLERELLESMEQGRPHLGIQLVGYQDVDTGFSTVAMMQHPGAMSGVSFFADSKHRLFGGNTLVCVPLAFCSSLYKPMGDHLVYRHTFKRPKFNAEEVKTLMSNGLSEQRLRAFVFTKCREGYETIPGMSYVGITSRSWQERYLEHAEQALEASSSTQFHESIRAMQGQKVVCVHDVSAYGLTKVEAKVYESKLISESTLWPLGLNMKA
jgi:hypothetical protein